MMYDRLVAEIPPTSGVVATPDVLVVKLVPDASSTTNVVLGCYSLCAVLILHYAVQQIVGVSSLQILVTPQYTVSKKHVTTFSTITLTIDVRLQ